jgi:hypothetical protein
MVARKLVQLRDQIDQQVLQLGQNVVALGHVNLPKNNFAAARGGFLFATPFNMTARAPVQKV